MTKAPRRLDVDEQTNTGIRPRLSITLDGDRVRDVVAYDCDAGWLMCIVHNDAGNRMTDGENYIIRKAYGRVDAVLHDD